MQVLQFALPLYSLVALALGAPLWLFPGRFLGTFGWAPVDPLLSRVLGAGLMAFAWGTWRSWMEPAKPQKSTLLEMGTAFTALAGIGLLRHLLIGNWPLMVWLVFAVLAVFAAVFALLLFRKQ